MGRTYDVKTSPNPPPRTSTTSLASANPASLVGTLGPDNCRVRTLLILGTKLNNCIPNALGGGGLSPLCEDSRLLLPTPTGTSLDNKISSPCNPVTLTNSRNVPRISTRTDSSLSLKREINVGETSR